MMKNKKKVRKSFIKRYKITGTMKFKRRKAFKSHILQKKSSKRKTRLSKKICLPLAEARKLRDILVI